MTAAEVSGKSSVQITPIGGATNDGVKMALLKYTKTNAGDYFTVGIAKSIVAVVKASINASGADDPATFATNVVTFTTGTGAGRAIILYK